MATNAPATIEENPLKRFEAGTLKAMDNREVSSGVPRTMFLPTSMGEAMELAKLMASGNFVPPHLRGKAGDCLAVVIQAGSWGMSPFQVASKTYFVSDKMAYEAQLVNAVINSSNVLDGRLKVEWEGDGNELVCMVSGRIKGDPDVKYRRVAIKNITTRNSPLWKQDPEQQIAYFTTRAWTRLYAPEVLMGVYTPDEIRDGLGTAGAADEVRELKTVSQMIEDQARTDPPHDPETGEVEGPSETDRGEVLSLDTAKAMLDQVSGNVPDINSRVSSLRQELSEADGDALIEYAHELIADAKGGE